jgi:hypothetical protein
MLLGWRGNFEILGGIKSPPLVGRTGVTGACKGTKKSFCSRGKTGG